MVLNTDEILDLLTDEDLLHIKKSTGRKLTAIVKAILFQDAYIKKLAEYLAMERKLGIRSKEVQLLMHDLINNQFHAERV